MRPFLPVEALLVAPLLALLLALCPAFAPVRRAFLTRPPPIRLEPGERLLAEIRPDAGVLGTLVLFVLGLTMATALAAQAVLGAELAAAYLPLAPFTLAALAHLGLLTRRRWRVTDRRVITELGAVLPLSEIGRIAVAPTRLRLDGQGSQSLRLTGLADARATARLIRSTLATRNR